MDFLGPSKIATVLVLVMSVLFSGAYAAKRANIEKTQKVCVIGGGPSGVMAATQLEKKGYQNIDLFEKDSQLGGKSKTVVSPAGNKVDLGTYFYDPGYSIVRTYANRYGFHFTNFTPNPLYFYNNITSEPFQLTASAEFLEAFTRLLQIKTQYADLIEYAGYPYWSSHPELQTDMQSWMINNNLTALLPNLWAVLSTSGYGPMTTVPAYYILTLLLPNVDILLNKLWYLEEGWQTLILSMASSLSHTTIHLSSEVTKLTRTNDVPVLTYTTATGSSQITCSKVIVAFPQLLFRLEFMDLDQKEQQVFSQVIYHKYMSVLFSTSTPPPASAYLEILGYSQSAPVSEPIGFGEPIGVITQQPDWHVAYSRIYEPNTNEPYTDADRNKVTTLFTQYANNILQLNGSTIVSVYEWDYFPHVSVDSIVAGWFHSARQLQGYRSTYWTSGLYSFEDIENSFQAAKQLVKRHF